MAAGKTTPVTITLTRAGRSAIAHAQRNGLRLTETVTVKGGATVRRTIVVRLDAPAAAGALAAPAGTTASCTNLKLGARASGKTVVLNRPGDHLIITLTQSFDGGYRWSVPHKPATSVLKLVSAKSVATKPAGSVGGTNDYVITYRAVATGRPPLKLIEDRSFQAHSTIAKFSLTVRVK